MAYNEDLELRLEQLLADYEDITAKKMFGGLCFLYRNKMCVGIVKDTLMVRVISEKFAEESARPHAREMDFTGRALKNFLFIEPEGFAHDDQIKHFIQLGIEHAEQAAAR